VGAVPLSLLAVSNSRVLHKGNLQYSAEYCIKEICLAPGLHYGYAALLSVEKYLEKLTSARLNPAAC